MKVLVITAHPRSDSLTASVTQNYLRGLSESGHTYELVDLYKEKFNPLLFPPDEPDWDNPDKLPSKEVIREQDRIKAADALVHIFPIWWYSMPAMLKGYIDRVWSYGFAYGTNYLPVDKVRWIGLASFSKEQFEKRSYDKMMDHHLNIGHAQYCGVEDSLVHYMYNSTGDFETPEEADQHFTMLLNQAYELGKSL